MWKEMCKKKSERDWIGECGNQLEQAGYKGPPNTRIRITVNIL